MFVKVYQPKNPTFRVNEEIDKYFEKDFNCVYTQEYDFSKWDNDNAILDYLFEIYNMKHPDGYKGYSLSVGDIVLLGAKTYICCNIGWKLVEFVGCAKLPACENEQDLVANNID